MKDITLSNKVYLIKFPFFNKSLIIFMYCIWNWYLLDSLCYTRKKSSEDSFCSTNCKLPYCKDWHFTSIVLLHCLWIACTWQCMMFDMISNVVYFRTSVLKVSCTYILPCSLITVNVSQTVLMCEVNRCLNLRSLTADMFHFVDSVMFVYAFVTGYNMTCTAWVTLPWHICIV